MIDIDTLLFRSHIKKDVLQIAFNLKEDDTYTTQDAIEDLLKIVEMHDL